MKLLLDTHIWVWASLEPKRLSRRLARVLSDTRHECWISPLSTWEVINLCRKGRLDLDLPAELWVERSLAASEYHEAPLTHEVARAAERVTLPHRDPLDRLLAATALVYGLTLITADKDLLRGTGFAVFRE